MCSARRPRRKRVRIDRCTLEQFESLTYRSLTVDRDEDIVLTILRERGSQRDYELVEGWHEDFVESGGDPTHSSGAKSFADLKELLA